MAVSGLLFNVQKFSLHDGPGIRTVVFFKGCPLSCRWCSNPESLDGQPCADARLYTLEEVLKVCLEDRLFYEESAEDTPLSSPEYSGGGVTLSGGEALGQADFARELLRALWKERVHTAIETSGFASPDIFDEITAEARLLLFDIKHFDNQRHIEGTGVPNDLIIANLKNALARNKNVLARIPVIPGYNNREEDARGFVSLLKSMNIQRVQLIPFHQFGAKKYDSLNLPYAMKNIPQLRPENLGEYRQAFLGQGIDCFF